ncbi:hypothetical protein NBRC110019_07300 [Neptunitalea chrysea]|uniref:site-specific DNA-methyltransferase (adenine-specific) n=1 Tax=Neptunitalea chrysea TaxID=1647581 RepID=A0A9W6B350_9FLAO|nr:DNA adenine methylase [Neptunitalea chrysea]GLB51691.1 hypothetical protein NBRC110019_07300 [Neptunitalea chrysea]
MNYNNAPLPFQGQKRNFIKKFKECLNSFEKEAVYVDLFGGSGLLSHTVKNHYPEAKVVWNDYDDFQKRLQSFEQTNELLGKLRPLLSHLKSKERLPMEDKQRVLEALKQHEKQYGYVDYVTVSSNILFSMKYAFSIEEMEKETMYNRIRLTDYQVSGYLDGVERVQCDYKELYETYKNENVVFLVDPPYLSTDTKSYNSKDYWRLRDYLDVLSVLDGHRYVYFTSNKSQIVELCDWIETRTYTGNPFKDAVMTTTQNRVNYQSGYEDQMLYKYSITT